MVKVKILNGAKSIGGNFVRIEDEDRTLIFDQGLRFDIMEKFYAGSITPKGLKELRDIGVVPKVEWYEGASTIYISHMHLDHMGLLSNIPPRIKVYLPSISIYEVMEEKWYSSATWLSMVPRKYYVKLEELRPMESDENNVMPLPVSHSAYPSYAFLYFGSDETVLYTGDFRVKGFLTDDDFVKTYGGMNMLNYFSENKDIRVDKLIIEGTNLGSIRVPITPSEEEAMLKRILNMHSLVMITIHPLDLEYIILLDRLSSEYGKNLYIASESAVKLAEMITELRTEPKVVSGYVKTVSHFESVELVDIEENSVLIAPYNETVDLMRDFKDANVLPNDSAVILTEPEPKIEEAQEYEAVINWSNRLKVQTYLMRTSGHYYPYELKTIINIIRPKKIDIIHTKAFA